MGDAKYRSLRETIPPVVYQRWPPDAGSPFTLHVRTSNRPDGIVEGVRRELAAIDPGLPFFEMRTLAQEVDATLWAERALAWLSSVFSGCALVLASFGVYATLAYAIVQSRREIGIRSALGAQTWDILRFFAARPLRFLALGIAAGLAVFTATGPVFRGVLYGASPVEPVRMLGTIAGVMLLSLIAVLVALKGVSSLDPAALLREE